MKTVNIRYAQNEPSTYQIGYRGDHNAVVLKIIPPPELLGADFYRLDWKLPDKSKHSSQDLYPENDMLCFPVSSALTIAHGHIIMQLKAFRFNGDEVAMQAAAQHKLLVVSPSEQGGPIPA